MKVLVTGASGLLGKYLAQSIPEGIDAAFTWFSVYQPWCQYQMDATNPVSVDYVFGKAKPDAVIHMAGVGDVDRCDKDYAGTWRVNVSGTRNVLAQGVPVLLTSTNAVYSGEQPPYGPYCDRLPANLYGKQWKIAEDDVMKYGGSIVRLFLLYGWEPSGARGNWASNSVRKLLRGERLRVVDDVFYQPTYAEDAAIQVWSLVGKQGEHHNVSGPDTVSLYEFVRTLARVWDIDESLVEPCRIAEFPNIARRPVDCSYPKTFGVRGIKDGLRAMRAS